MKKVLLLFLALSLGCSVHAQLREALSASDYKSAVRIIDEMLPGADSSEVRNLSMEKARCLRKLYRTGDAIRVLTAIQRPNDWTVLAELADCFFEEGKSEDAYGYYSLLSMAQPENVFFRLRKAVLLYRLKGYEAAISEAKAVLQTDSIPRAAVLAGDAYTELQQGGEALGMYERALAMAPDDLNIVTRIVRNKLGSRDYQGVLETVAPYLEKDPDEMRLLPSKGLALYKLKEYKPSADVFEHLKELGDTLSYSTRFFLGQDYAELKVIYRAEQELQAAWQIDSSDVELALSIASVKSLGMRPFDKEVKPWYDKAYAMLQPDPVLLYKVCHGYAVGCFRKNDWNNAILWYKKAYEANPDKKTCLSSIGYCYEQLKDYKTALSYYEEYLKTAKPGSTNYKFAEESVRFLKGELFMQER